MESTNAPIEELRRLYLDEGWSLQKIGDHFGISRQAVHERLKRDGVEFRRYTRRTPPIDRETLKRLYIAERLAVRHIAEQLGQSPDKIYESLHQYQIPVRRGCPRKYPALEDLKVGESIVVPKPEIAGSPHISFYMMARKLGIKLSVKTVADNTLRITRTQ